MRYSALSIFLLALCFFSSCKKEKNTSRQSTTFCKYVNADKIDSTQTLITQFLSDYKDVDTDSTLNALANWIANQTCVDSCKVLCNSCIETLPEQSEIRIDYGNADQYIIVDITMTNPPVASGFHE